MGTWGHGLFADDVASDIRGQYRDYLLEGLSGEAATDRLLREYAADASDTGNAGAVFWLALAVTQWKLGRLEGRVRTRALEIIDAGQGLDFWERETGSARRRAAVYAQAKATITAPQRSPVKLRQPPRPKCLPGEVLEIQTERGLAYAQYTHQVAGYGELITAFEGFHATRPDPLRATSSPVQFQLITLVDHAVRRRFMTPIGAAPIPPSVRAFPVFRHRPPWSDRWAFWDGKREWQAAWDELDDAELRDLPDLTIYPPAGVAPKIARGWRLADAESLDPTFDGFTRAVATGCPGPRAEVPGPEPLWDWAAAPGDPPAAVPLKIQLAELVQCGIKPREGVSRAVILEWRDEDWYRRHPYVALLAELGRIGPDGEPRSPDVCLVDNAAVDGPDAYVRLLARMGSLTRGALAFTDITADVDLSGPARVAFALNGKRYCWDLVVEGPWLDRTLFARLVELLAARRVEHRYFYAGLGLRYFVTGCLTARALRRLRRLSGRRMLWLE